MCEVGLGKSHRYCCHEAKEKHESRDSYIVKRRIFGWITPDACPTRCTCNRRYSRGAHYPYSRCGCGRHGTRSRRCGFRRLATRHGNHASIWWGSTTHGLTRRHGHYSYFAHHRSFLRHSHYGNGRNYPRHRITRYGNPRWKHPRNRITRRQSSGSWRSRSRWRTNRPPTWRKHITATRRCIHQPSSTTNY